jgi:hypothetical protein
MNAVGARWQALADLVGAPDSVLDIGCRDRGLKAHLPTATRYVGLDRQAPADVVASAEHPLPFADDEFETAVLADVLEHLDDPHVALREAMRVSSAAVVLVLPNLYFYKTRLAILRGRPISEKYRLSPVPVPDRHRWFPHFDDARDFTRGMAEQTGWRVAREVAFDGWPQRPASRAITTVLRRISDPSLWALAYGARIES